MGESRVRLDRLTSLRFFAAMVVVLNHVTRDLGTVPGVSNVMTMGTAGVGFFFALSGFLLTWSHRPNDTAGRFYRRRFARVYPLQFVTFLIAIPVLMLTGIGFSLPAAATNVVLIQSWFPDVTIYFGMNAPSWSLACEAFFYLVFPFAIIWIRRISANKAGLALLILLTANVLIGVAITVAVHGGETARYLLYVFPLYRLIGFLAGCMLAHWMSSGVRFNQPIALAAALVAAGYLAVYSSQRLIHVEYGHGVEDALLLPLVLFLIGAAATADLAGRPGILRRSLLLRLGEWSFALYLTHWLLLQVVAYALPWTADAQLPVRILLDLAFIAVAIAVSAAAYYGIERPLEKRLRGAPLRPEMAATSGGRHSARLRGQ